MSFHDEIMKFLSGYDNDSFYIGSAISQKRMQSAIKAHGVDPRDQVWAMIDSTVMGATSMGSADNGMSITATGIFWKNMWATKTRLNHYTWQQLAPIAERMEVAGGNVRFEPGVEFASISFKAQHVVNMLQALVRLYLDQQAMVAQAGEAAPQPAAAVPMVEAPPLALPAATGSDDYARTLGTALALIVCHAGAVDDACAGIAIDLLTAEEADSPGALAAFEEAIEALAQEAARSATFLKLRQAKLVAGLAALTGAQQEQALIMAEAVAEQAEGGAADMLGRIGQRLGG